jgi:ubiquinone/menaquinone biosynthesis C-methylase UbiE
LSELSDACTDERKHFNENALKFNDIAMKVFAPVYPVLAEQIIDECCITRGVCIDVGSGPTLLALELAKRTNLIVYALDISDEMLKTARENVGKAGLNGKVVPICGDVCAMPFKNGFADLVISRGSLPFWHNKMQAFHEIYRVLKVGGATFIGGGFGKDVEVRNKIKEEILKLHREMPKPKKARLTTEYLQLILKKAQIPKFKIVSDESGLWVKIEK